METNRQIKHKSQAKSSNKHFTCTSELFYTVDMFSIEVKVLG